MEEQQLRALPRARARAQLRFLSTSNLSSRCYRHRPGVRAGLTGGANNVRENAGSRKFFWQEVRGKVSVLGLAIKSIAVESNRS